MELQTCLTEFWHIFYNNSLMLLIRVPLPLVKLLFENPELIHLLFSHNKVFARQHCQVFLILAFYDSKHFIWLPFCRLKESDWKSSNLFEV